MDILLKAIPIAIPVILVILFFLLGYLKAPPDVAYIISGLRKHPKVLIGKAGIKIPFLERVDKLIVRQISIDIKSEGYIPTQDFIGVDVDAVAKVRVMTDPEGIQLAMKNFLNMTEDDFNRAIVDSLQGNMREIIGTITLKEICNDRKKFGDEVQSKAQTDMNALGIQIISCNIQRVTDENSLISSLGQDNMSKIQKDAAIAKAEAERDIAIAQAQAAKASNDAQVEADMHIAQKQNDLAIKQSELKVQEDTKRAEADAAYTIQQQEQQRSIETATVNAQIAKTEREAELKSKELQLNTELNSLLEKGDPQLSMENLAHVIELWTKIPAAKIREQEFQRLSQLEVRLKSHIIGQDEAVSAVAAAVRRNRVGISPKHKPVSFIFVGPTGVGKTELVKQLATDLFNTPDALIRLDMSEFMEKHSVSRLVGSPPGYVGYDEAGQLTEKIRRKPYAVVLFDEIEKAHPDVLNILLQILDDGEITDAHGRKVNFENTIIVMTSNAGSATKEGTVGFGRSVNEQDADRAMKALQQFLRPEFINRVDAVITFNRLSEENFHGIARIMLNELVGSLKEKGITFTYDDALVELLTKKSYSLTYGARNLRRTIQKELEDPMATKIIDSYEHPITQVKATVEDGAIRLYTL